MKKLLCILSFFAISCMATDYTNDYTCTIVYTDINVIQLTCNHYSTIEAIQLNKNGKSLLHKSKYSDNTSETQFVYCTEYNCMSLRKKFDEYGVQIEEFTTELSADFIKQCWSAYKKLIK